MVEDPWSWCKWLADLRAASPISFEAVIAILVVTMVLFLMLIERIREPNKVSCARPLRNGCSSAIEAPANPSLDF